MPSAEEYREKRIKEHISKGDYPHGFTHVPGEDEIPGITAGITSDPPTGKDKAVNIYYNPDTHEQVIIT